MGASPWQHRLFLWEPRHEGPGTRLGVVVKRTYDLERGRPIEPSESPYPLFEGDVHFGNPGETSVQHESDVVPFKPATDVVVNGRAWARRGAITREVRVAVRVGRLRKELVVFGDRYVEQRPNFEPFFSAPRPFESMLVRYEYAYGGTDPKGADGQPTPYPRNPVGMGFAVSNPDLTVDGMALPNVEDPSDLLSPSRFVVDPMRWETAPRPAGLGWIPRAYWDRRQRQGLPESMREVWDHIYNRRRDGSRVERKAFQAFDPAYYNGASDGLAVPHLRGNETILLERMDPDAEVFEVVLPGVAPVAAIEVAGGRELPVDLTLNTVAIQKEERLAYLVWGGVPPIDRDPQGIPPPDLPRMVLRVGEQKVR